MIIKDNNLGLLPVLVTLSTYMATAKETLAKLGLSETRIQQLFGARAPRYTQDELLELGKLTYNNLLGRDPDEGFLSYWYPKIMFGYLNFDDLTNAIKETNEYKAYQAKISQTPVTQTKNYAPAVIGATALLIISQI